MTVKSIRLLFRFDFPSKTMRLWDGSGPYLDLAGDIWKGITITEGLDTIEAALNGEANRLFMGVSGIPPEIADLAWQDHEAGDVIGSTAQVLIQDCNEHDDPVGAPEARFTGEVDDIIFDDSVTGETVSSTVMIECVGGFDLRAIASGRVISDADQKARSAMLNPSATPDRIAERVPKLQDKTIGWPRFR
jgi:hypothetical protein